MPRDPDTEWDCVDSILKRLSGIRHSLVVLLVSCVKGTTSPADDYATHSIQTEFFSDQELAYIVGCLRRFGLFVRLFTSEMEFIEWVLAGGMEKEQYKQALAYNTAHTGSGPGRKALLPAFCDLNGIPYTGSNPHVVSLARHKFHSACVLQSRGVRVPSSWFYVPGRGWLDDIFPPDGVKVIAKLTHESASIGLSSDSVLVCDESLTDRIDAIGVSFHQPVTVQQLISGREVEVPIVDVADGFAPMAVGISVDGKDLLGDVILTYDLVNDDLYGFTDYQENSDRMAEAMKKTALNVARILEFRGLSRVDFRVDETGQHFVTDVSTSPHITPHSSFEFTFDRFDRAGTLPILLVGLACQRLNWI
jgi:D-alanine-D-alanine ligase